MAASVQVTGPKKRVLLVITSMSKRNLRASVLRKCGIEVVCAAQVSDARMLWHPSTYDLVLFDMSHDSASASELCSDMKSEFPRQKVAWLVGKPELLSAAPVADRIEAPEIPNRLEENLRQLMTNACEALPRRGGFLEARWRMALIRSVKPEQQADRPPTLALPVIEAPLDHHPPVSFGDAVRQAEADQEDKQNKVLSDTSGTILLFVPDERLRNAHAKKLNSHGYKVAGTGDVDEAHSICLSEKPDLVLVGISDPVSQVFEICDELRRRYPDQKIALVPGELPLCPVSFDGVASIDVEQGFIEQIEALIGHKAAIMPPPPARRAVAART